MDKFLRAHFAPPHFAFLSQVRNGTGFRRKTTRTADAMAMGTWPSRGIHLHGIEVKVDYQDFKRELANPEKAEDIAKYCHFWWMAVTHEKVAPIDQVPAGWGLLVVSEDCETLRVARPATISKPEAPDHLMLASMLRNVAQNYIHADNLKDWKNNARVELEQAADRNSKYLRESSMEIAKKSQELVAKVETALGCRISEWSVDGFAADFALAKKLRSEGTPMIRAVESLVRMADQFRPQLDAIKSAFDKKT